tara:strand:+ start:1386 stop:2753 length:1368 start_codon:yes stop_codon:yes gene_type:complete
MSFPAYPEYKESGDEWLGKVPEHWQALALSRVLAAPVTDGPHTTPEFLDDGVPFLSVDGIQDGKLYFEGCRYVSFEDHKEFSKKAAPKYNDLLMGKAASIGKIARVTENIEFSIWSPLALIRVNEGQCSPEFLEFCLKSSELQHQVLLASNSNTQLNIGMKDIPKLRIPLPAVQEQTQIARFLDHETARIDALIEEQQRLIELLKEKRQAVISHAVTKGLDPTVPMKDSGVEWLGEVPAHWVASKFGYISSVVRGGSPRPAGDPELFNGDYSPWVTVAEITKDDEIYLDETETFLTKKGSDQCRIFSKGTLLLSNSGATLGVPKILMINANANDGVVGFENLSLDKEYSYLYLATLTEGLRDRAAGSGQPNLNTDIVKSIDVPIPPSNEVAEIVAAVKKLRAQFNFLSKEAVEGIRLLQERRSALISAAVTGKIDVRGWRPPASAPSPELVQEAV